MKEQHKDLKQMYYVAMHNTFELYEEIRQYVACNIRYQILALVAAAVGSAAIIFIIISSWINHSIGYRTYETYDESRAQVQQLVLDAIGQINSLDKNLLSNQDINELKALVEEEESDINNEMLLEIINEPLQHMPYGYLNVEATDVFKVLKTLQDNNNWSKETVLDAIKDLYKQQGIELTSLTINQVKTIIDQMRVSLDKEATIYLVDSTGKLLIKDSFIESINLVKVIQNTNSEHDDSTFSNVYPVIINGQVDYILINTKLVPFEHGYYNKWGTVLGILAAVGIFIVMIFRLTRGKIAYIEYLSSCINEIAKGDLSYNIEMIGQDELAQVAKDITVMEQEIKKRIEAQMKAEYTKNELITNVAHDLRTPLTSIIGYIGLVKDKGYQTEEEKDKYLEIAYAKAEQLKVIMEDLFELSKLHQHGVKLNKQKVSISNILNQLVEEMMPIADDKAITIETYISPIGEIVEVDINKITRVFQNLIENAIKYTAEGETIYIELKAFKKDVRVAISNPCKAISQEEIDRFFERSYRADQSRNSKVGGSGLGLAIANNIVLLHDGTINAKLNHDLISFKVSLPRIEEGKA